MTILWDKHNRVFIRAKNNMAGQMEGLCGNFNSIQDDDYWAVDGITHEDVYEFASLWQVSVLTRCSRLFGNLKAFIKTTMGSFYKNYHGQLL